METQNKTVANFLANQEKQNELLKEINSKEVNSLVTHSDNSVKIDDLKESNAKILEDVHTAYKERFNKMKQDTKGSMTNKQLIKSSFEYVKLTLGNDAHKDTLRIVDALENYYTSKFFAKYNLTYKVIKNVKSLGRYITKSAFSDVYNDVILDNDKEATLWGKAKALKSLYGIMKKQVSMNEIVTISERLAIVEVNKENATVEFDLQYFSSTSLSDINAVLNAITLSKLQNVSLSETLPKVVEEEANAVA